MTSRDDLRIGDAEREEMMTALREHFAQGRITHDELDERLELTLNSRTGRELAKVADDLPDPRPAVQPEEAPPPARERRHRHHHWHGAHMGHGRNGHGRRAPWMGPILPLFVVVMMVGGPRMLVMLLFIWLAFTVLKSAHHHLHRMHSRP